MDIATAAIQQRIERARVLTTLLDSCFRIPGTSKRFGIDPLLSLVPFAGDTASAMISGYIMLIALQFGAPFSIVGRMALNVLIDMVVGFVPVLGDVADFGLKANTRNMRLLEKYLQHPSIVQRSSRVMIIGFILLIAGLLILGVILAYYALHLIATWLGLPGVFF